MLPVRGVRAACPLLLLHLLPILAPINVVQGFNTTYQNFKGTQTCKAFKIFRPLTPQRVSEIIFEAKSNGLRVRAVGGRFSSNRIICTDGYALDMSGMRSVMIDEKAMQVTAGAGAKLIDIYTALKNKGYSFKISASQFAGATIGGVLGGGSFVSSLKHPPLYDQVIRMTMVDGRGSILAISGLSLKATRVNLGWLGVVTDVTLPIVPLFKMTVEMMEAKEDLITNGDYAKEARQYDFYKLSWFVSLDALVVTKGTNRDANVEGTDVFDHGFAAGQYTESFAGQADAAMSEALSGNATTLCNYEKASFGSLAKQTCCTLNVYVNEERDSKNPATGWIHEVTSTYCEEGKCAWDYGGASFLAEGSGVAVRLEDLPEAFQITKAILKRRNICFITTFGVQILFLKKSDSYLATSFDSDVAIIRMERARRQNKTLAGYGDAAVQEVFLTLARKFNGRPVWDHAHGLLEPFPSIQEMYPKWSHFVAFRDRMQSYGVFDSESLYMVTRQKSLRKTKHCEVFATCNCSNDIHCAVGEVCHTKNTTGAPFKFCDRAPS